jgi:serine/threonine protein kinase
MIIGLYQVEKTIGRGYFGKVKRCVHKLTQERVAIKTLRRKQYEKIGVRPRNLLLCVHCLRDSNKCGLDSCRWRFRRVRSVC